MPINIRQRKEVNPESITARAQATWARFISPDPVVTSLRSIFAKDQAAREILHWETKKPLKQFSRDEFMQMVRDIRVNRTKIPTSVDQALREILEITHHAVSTEAVLTDLRNWQKIAFAKQEGVLKPALTSLAIILGVRDAELPVLNIISNFCNYNPQEHGHFEAYATKQLRPTTRDIR